jgi:hypothetical protein
MEEDGRLDALRDRNTFGRRHPDHFCETCGAKFKPNGQSTLKLRWCEGCRGLQEAHSPGGTSVTDPPLSSADVRPDNGGDATL